MATKQRTDLSPTPEQRRVAAQQYERARQAMTSGNYDYGIELLRTSCQLEPANLIFRKALRRSQKNKFNNNLRGSMFAWLSTAGARARLKRAKQSGDHLKVLECGEIILSKNPWSTGTQLDMAAASEALGLVEVAVWMLEQARQKDPRDPQVNRPLARLYEQQGNYAQAIAMWDLVAKAVPRDNEAARKGKDLAATHTIVKGNYEEVSQSGTNTSGERPLTAREVDLSAAIAASAGPVDPLARQVEPLRKKLEADPANPNPYLQLSTVYQRAQHLDKARGILEEGLAATGQNFDIQQALADLEILPFHQNLGLVEEKIRENPNDARLRQLRDNLVKEINARELACFRQRADRFPADLGYRLELGVRLSTAGQTDEAIQELQLARRDPRHRARALLHLGHCFKSRKNWTLAKRNYTEALQGLSASEEKSRKELMYNLALLAVEEKDWRTAVELGTELANLDFSYQDIGRRLDEWQANLDETNVESQSGS